MTALDLEQEIGLKVLSIEVLTVGGGVRGGVFQDGETGSDLS
jgi:hypothetical protein